MSKITFDSWDIWSFDYETLNEGVPQQLSRVNLVGLESIGVDIHSV
jgi:hypothetical protein